MTIGSADSQVGWPHIPDLFWQAGIAAGVLFVVLNFTTCSKDPYGEYHISLNISPGGDPEVWPDTEWLNMGYWKDTRIFPEACEALALKVIKRANCVSGGHVLDVGHACGDSLLLHLRHPNVPRPATLTGITSLSSQYLRAVKRVAEYQSSHPCELRLCHNDAIFRRPHTDHPLSASFPTPPFTSIIALDCAYHFASRELFLRQCFARLSPSGTIALADLAVSKPLPFGLRILLSTLLSVRSENMVTPSVYKEQLKMIGYVNVHVEDISHHVFPGFRTFLRSRGGIWRILDLVIGSWVATGGLFLIVNATKPATQTQPDKLVV